MSERTHVVPRLVSVTTVRHMRALFRGGHDVGRIAYVFGFDGVGDRFHNESGWQVVNLLREPPDAALDTLKAVRCEATQ